MKSTGRDANNWLVDGSAVAHLSPDEAYGTESDFTFADLLRLEAAMPLPASSGSWELDIAPEPAPVTTPRPARPLPANNRPVAEVLSETAGIEELRAAPETLLGQIEAAAARFIATSDNPPDIPWFIEGWMPEREPTLMAGPGGGGKSYLALQLQVAATLGRAWLGLSVPQCASLGFYSEDGFEAVAHRLHQIAAHYRTSVADLVRRGMRVLPKPRNTALVTCSRDGAMTTTAAFAELRATAKVIKPGLLVLDNIADFWPFPSFDNTAIRMARRMTFDRLCEDFDLAILGLQNVTLAGLRSTDENEGGSGGLAWRDAFRSRLVLKSDTADPDEPSDGRKLVRKKANNAPDDQDGIKLRWGNGLWVQDSPGGDAVTRIERGVNERWLLDAVTRIAEGNGPAYSTAHNKPNYLPKVLFAQQDRPRGYGGTAIRNDYERLVNAGTIVIGEGRDPLNRKTATRVMRVGDYNVRSA